MISIAMAIAANANGSPIMRWEIYAAVAIDVYLAHMIFG